MNYYVTKLRRLCGFIAGFIFYISGILKLLDPVGAGLVMDEYFSFLHLDFLGFASKMTGTALAFAEAVLGTAMITGVWRKPVAVLAFVFQGFFTVLTLILVIFNPEMDCGCFGEAIHLQTFLKNIVLILLLVIAYIPMRDLGEPRKIKYVSFTLVTLSVAAFAVYSWMYIPMKDFTEYESGAVLHSAASAVPEEEMFEAAFVYEKDGKEEYFDLQHLPDSTWTFVRTETVMKEGAGDTGINLSFYDAGDEYRDALAAEGKVLVISVYDPDMKPGRWEKIADRVRYSEEAGFRTLVITSSTPEAAEDFLKTIGDESGNIIRNSLYFSDYKTLITLNRSNGGATYFSDGYLICKWAGRNLPDSAELHEVATGDDTEAIIGQSTRSSLSFQAFLLYVFAIMLLL